MKNGTTQRKNGLCDRDKTPAVMEEMEAYCMMHPRGPAAVRRPRLMIRGKTFVAVLGASIAEGIVGFGLTASQALRAFDSQYLRSLQPPRI